MTGPVFCLKMKWLKSLQVLKERIGENPDGCNLFYDKESVTHLIGLPTTFKSKILISSNCYIFLSALEASVAGITLRNFGITHV